MSETGEKKIGFLKRYKDEIRLFLTIFIFLCSLIGSIEYYLYFTNIEFPSTFRFIVAIFQSTVSLFLANAKADIGTPTPFLYELARFLAPLLTTYCIYKAIQENFLQYFGRLKYHFMHSNQIVIFGKNKASSRLIDQVHDANKAGEKRTILLVTNNKMSGEERLDFEKKSVHIRSVDYYLEEDISKGVHSLRKNLFSKLNLETTKEIVFFEQDETVNYALFGELLEISPKLNSGIRCAVYVSSPSIADSFISLYDTFVKAGNKSVSLILFDTAELEAVDMIRQHPFHEPVISLIDKENKTIESLCEIPAPHIVICGLGTCGMAVLETVMKAGVFNTGSTASTNRRTMVTVIDKNNQIKKVIEKEWPRIDQVLDLNFIYGDISESSVITAFEKLPRITYVALCYSQQKSNYIGLNQFKRYIRYANTAHNWPAMTVPIGVRMEENLSFIRFIEEAEHCDDYTVFGFGNLETIIRMDNILRNKTEELAMSYNAEYQKLLAIISRDPEPKVSKEDQWKELSYELLRSNRAAVMNIPFFKEAIRLLRPDLPSMEQLTEWAGKPGAILPEIENTKTEQLVEMEHLRWMNFYYSLGYVGSCESGKDKRKYMLHKEGDQTWFGQVHNCLIPYSELKANPTTNGTIHYDLSNVIAYNRYQL